ncbi:hypothetical protein MMC22_002755 [Lobaria immixta]|nr:hypothetical protein [Lobaria immixta]
MAAVQEDSINARNLSMLQSGKHSDMIICCEGVSLYVHQAIVCSASKFFASAYHGDFKEARTGVIFLEDQLEIVKMMLLYFYTLDYDEQDWGGSRGGNGSGSSFGGHSCSDDKKCQSLRNGRQVHHTWVEGVGETKFKILSSSARLILDHPSIIDEVYDATPSEDRGLRDIMTNLCAPHVQEIIHGNGWSTTAQMHVEFTFDLLRTSAATLQATQKNLQVTQKKLQWTEEALQAAREFLYSTETQFKSAEVVKQKWKLGLEERDAKAGDQTLEEILEGLSLSSCSDLHDASSSNPTFKGSRVRRLMNGILLY